jgi:hypothetical protein
MKVHSVEEAMDWFLNHAYGAVICIRSDGEEKECKSFPEAKRFFAFE